MYLSQSVVGSILSDEIYEFYPGIRANIPKHIGNLCLSSRPQKLSEENYVLLLAND